MRITIDTNNAITLAIIIAVCFIASKDRSSNTLVLLSLILAGVFLLNRESTQLDNESFYAISGQKLGAYGNRN